MKRVKSNIPGSAMCHCGSIEKGFKADRRWICADCSRPLWMTIDTAPDDDTDVLVLSDGFIWIASFYHGIWWFEKRDDSRRSNPTHWMPLPDAPRHD